MSLKAEQKILDDLALRVLDKLPLETLRGIVVGVIGSALEDSLQASSKLSGMETAGLLSSQLDLASRVERAQAFIFAAECILSPTTPVPAELRQKLEQEGINLQLNYVTDEEFYRLHSESGCNCVMCCFKREHAALGQPAKNATPEDRLYSFPAPSTKQ